VKVDRIGTDPSSLDTRIAMKRVAGRAQDRADLEQLLLLREGEAGEDAEGGP